MSSDDAASAIVQGADASERVVVLEVRIPGRTSFVVIGAAKGSGDGVRAAAGLLPKSARQEIWGARLPPGSARQRGREAALALARVVAVTDTEVYFEPRPKAHEAEVADAAVEDVPPGPVLVRCLRVHGGRVVITDVPPPKNTTPLPAVLGDDRGRRDLETRGIELAKALADDAVEIHRVELVRSLEKARARIERRCSAVRDDLAKIAQADRLAAQAQWLVGEAARAPRGATKLVVTDWSSGEAVPIVVPLDPAKSAREQVETMFKRAKRLKLGGRIAEERLALAETQARAVEAAIESVQNAPSLGAMDKTAREAKRQAPRDVILEGVNASAAGADARGPGASAATGAAKGRRVPYRTFMARSGRKVLVGKGAIDNDTLTLRVARPHDLWLHAKDRPGAHVVVQLDKGQTCPAEDLVDAAHLAAHFSDARDEKAVDVSYTPRRYVRKSRGAPPGLVIVDREKILPLRFDATLLRQLLEREEL